MSSSSKGTSKTTRGGVKRKPRPMISNSKIINPNRKVDKKRTDLRSKDTIKRLQMYKQKAVHDREGKFVTGPYMSRTADERIKRVQPDRRWFGNTRVVGQRELETFREEMTNQINDPYTVVMRNSKLPMGLLSDPYKNAKMNLLTTESFAETYGKKSVRKKPRLASEYSDMESLLKHVADKSDNYLEKNDKNVVTLADKHQQKHTMFERGQSKRIWMELYKVIDSSDVIVQVLDVRDPMGTRSRRIETELQTRERRHKHMVLVLNKCDLVPTWVTARWVKVLSREYPTLAFHASITNPFGKGALIQLLRQFATLHKDKKQISVGFVGYPNVGKSAVINTLRKKKVCPSAPTPGETKVWRYITLFKRVFLIDCPGVVYPNDDSQADTVLKGVVRIEMLESPLDYIEELLSRVKAEYIVNNYGIASWKSAKDFIKKYSKRAGKLLKGGEPDYHTTARMVLTDWQRGRLPYFECPPFDDSKEEYNKKKKARDSQIKVEQLFSKIAVRTKFSQEDNQAPAGYEVDESREAAENEDLDDDDEEDEDEGDEEKTIVMPDDDITRIDEAEAPISDEPQRGVSDDNEDVESHDSNSEEDVELDQNAKDKKGSAGLKAKGKSRQPQVKASKKKRKRRKGNFHQQVHA
mmetsp:Transcript_17228/g.33566  ORF Transcript_17228/g.33566 Transcript_17228/m.33566 type:complete len:638 (+) Transcript_17228:60-1973(+)